MKFFIATENGSGSEYFNKEEFLAELGRMIDDCEANGGTQFDVEVYPNAECFYHPEDDNDEVSYDKVYYKVLPIVQDWFGFLGESECGVIAATFAAGMTEEKDCSKTLAEVCEEYDLDYAEFEGFIPELAGEEDFNNAADTIFDGMYSEVDVHIPTKED